MAKFQINLKTGTLATSSEAETERPKIIVGIDLGTTNSLVAYLADGNPKCVRGTDGKHTLVPSVLHFAKDGQLVVGDEAKQKQIAEPSRTVFSVKRLMGKSFKDVGAVEHFFGYKILNDDTDALVKVRMDDRFYTPIELSAEILKELKRRVESELGESVERAVITVPAYFNDAQRQATRDAGKLAGLDVLRILNEPTAASLAYGLGLKDDDEGKTIAVYDLGGGTFDISILRIEQGVFEVLATHGDTFLGGDDFDQAIVKHWQAQNGISDQQLSEDKELAQTLRLRAEQAKKQLSGTGKWHTPDASPEGLASDAFQLSAETFELLAKPLIDRTLESCRQAVNDAKIKLEELDEIVLVGGSTRMPLVKKAVETFFGKTANDSLNPDEVVALGAAVQADILAGNNKDFLLLDITPLTLGIETVGGLMDGILARNSKVPAAVARNYTTSIDGQTNLKVSVYQGERDLVKDNRKLGEFTLRGIPPMPAGLPKIEITFVINADGILTVKAKELRSGVSTSVEMRSTYGITQEEMGRMLMDSVRNARSDMAIRSLLEARNEANSVLLAADKFLLQNANILDEEEATETKRLASILAQAVQGESKDDIQAAMQSLNEYTAPLAHRAMDVNIAEALKGKAL